MESGEIILTNLQQSDTANYTCQVDNTQGSDRIIHSLVVQGKEKLFHIKIKIEQLRWIRPNSGYT